jgi:hypothetical protein
VKSTRGGQLIGAIQPTTTISHLTLIGIPRMFSIPDPSRHRKLCEPIAGEPFSCATIGCEQLRTVLGRLDRPHQASLESGGHRQWDSA